MRVPPKHTTASLSAQFSNPITSRTPHPISNSVILVLALTVSLMLFTAGCGGGGSSSSGGTSGSGGSSSSGSGGGTTTPDMGAIVNVNNSVYDSNQYQIKNAATDQSLGISGQSQTAGTTVVQESTSDAPDEAWHFMQNVYASDEVNIGNMLTHQVLGFSTVAPVQGVPSSSALSSGAQAVQYSDTGTDDQNWQLFQLSDGNYLIKNHYSGLYLQADGSGASVVIDQGARATTGTGCTCQEWTLTSTGTSPYPAPMAVKGTGIYVHDPYMLQDANHVYWLYGTHQTLAYSTDLSTFTYTTASTPYGACTAAQGTAWLTDDGHCPIIGPDFASWSGLQTPPSDNNGQNTDVWAPSLMYVNGIYYQYYAIPVEPDMPGGEAIIGLATSPSPSGPWTDKGWIIASWSNTSTPISGFGFNSGTTYNAIDPAPFVDAAGNWWLSFGSWFDGIHMLQLDPSTGLRLASNPTTYNIAYRYWGEEGSFIYYWNGYYYYFAPINACCSPTSPYRIIYGRSANPTGPYLDRGGVDLEHGGGTILLSAHGNIVGPGGQSVFTDTGADGTQSMPTLVYHYYDGSANGTPTLGINQLAFTTDGWPYVK
ncbi:MAG: family 43 glycosylhydrolase [Acidobacteriaceae bacterium]